MIFHSLTFFAESAREVYNTSRGTLGMLMNDKIMFDCHYCINSTKPLQKLRKYWHILIYNLVTFSYACTLS